MRKAYNHPGQEPASTHSQAIEVSQPSRMLFLAGQVGIAPDGTIPATVSLQAKQAFANVTALLEQAGMSSDNIVKTTVYMTDKADIPEFLSTDIGLRTDPMPAGSLIVVDFLFDPAIKIEIEVIAVA